MDERLAETEQLGEAYLAEAIEAIDQGNFTFEGEVQREQVLCELMKALIQPHLNLG